jgi:anti-sigma B factor antagonist
MTISGQAFGPVVVVSIDVPCEIDVGNADAFRDGALAAAGAAQAVVIDCGRIEFFDSAGLGALLSIQKRVAERGGRVVLASLNRAVSDIFRMVGFDVVFVSHPDVPGALAALGVKG